MSLDFNQKDLTANLPSIEFNAVIKENYPESIHLRSRSHFLFISGCLHIFYFYNILNIFRRGCQKILDKGPDVAFNKLMLQIDESIAERTKVGIIGYGRLGSTICQEFLNNKIVAPENLYVTSRNMDLTRKLQDKGVNVAPDCQLLIDQCTLLVICVLPHQLEHVARQFRMSSTSLDFDQILYVFTSGQPIERLHRLFQHESIITPTQHPSILLWNDGKYDSWNYRLTLNQLLKYQDIIGQTCPVSVSTNNALFVNYLPKLYTLWIYSLCNIGTCFKLPTASILRLLNFVLFKTDMSASSVSSGQSIPNFIQINDLLHGMEASNEKLLPTFSLCSIMNKVTFIDQKLERDLPMQEALYDYYSSYLLSFSKLQKFNVN